MIGSSTLCEAALKKPTYFPGEDNLKGTKCILHGSVRNSVREPVASVNRSSQIGQGTGWPIALSQLATQWAGASSSP